MVVGKIIGKFVRPGLRTIVKEIVPEGGSVVKKAAQKAATKTGPIFEGAPKAADLTPVTRDWKLLLGKPEKEVNAILRAQTVEAADTIEKKIARYLKLIPDNAKMKAPVKIEINGWQFEMMVDKTKNHVATIQIKELGIQDPSSLNIVVDNAGKMIEGTFLEKAAYRQSYKFTRDNKNMRRIEYCSNENPHDVHTFRPIQNGGFTHVFKDDFFMQPLGQIFMSLADLYKTII